MKLHSLLISGDSLFTLVEDESDKKLHLQQNLFSNKDDLARVPFVLKSRQPDMLIPPESVKHIDIQLLNEEIHIEQSANGDKFVAVDNIDDWVVFFLDIEPKILIHVQPKFSEFNFHDYKHEDINTNLAEEMMAKLEEQIKKSNTDMETFFSEIDKIAAEVESMEADSSHLHAAHD